MQVIDDFKFLEKLDEQQKHQNQLQHLYEADDQDKVTTSHWYTQNSQLTDLDMLRHFFTEEKNVKPNFSVPFQWASGPDYVARKISVGKSPTKGQKRRRGSKGTTRKSRSAGYAKKDKKSTRLSKGHAKKDSKDGKDYNKDSKDKENKMKKSNEERSRPSKRMAGSPSVPVTSSTSPSKVKKFQDSPSKHSTPVTPTPTNLSTQRKSHVRSLSSSAPPVSTSVIPSSSAPSSTEVKSPSVDVIKKSTKKDDQHLQVSVKISQDEDDDTFEEDDDAEDDEDESWDDVETEEDDEETEDESGDIVTTDDDFNDSDQDMGHSKVSHASTLNDSDSLGEDFAEFFIDEAEEGDDVKESDSSTSSEGEGFEKWIELMKTRVEKKKREFEDVAVVTNMTS